MPTTLDLSDDYLIWDNPEGVDVVLRGTEQTIAIASAVKRQIRRRERDTFGGLLNNDAVIWEIAQAQLGAGNVIDEGDYINATEIAASGNWVVVRADHATFKTRWRCYCNKQR